MWYQSRSTQFISVLQMVILTLIHTLRSMERKYCILIFNLFYCLRIEFPILLADLLRDVW